MPILLKYGPLGSAADAALNVGDEKLRRAKAEESLRRQQAYEEQQRYDEEQSRRREQDRLNEDYRRRQLDLEGQRNDNLYGYRKEQGDLSQQRIDKMDSPEERAARQKDAAIARGDLEGARFFHQQEMQARQQKFSGGQNDLNRASHEGIANNANDQRANQFDQTMEYKKSRDQEHDDLLRELSAEKMKALTAAANARDEKSRQSALTAAADLDYRAAVHSTDRHYREKPRPDPITGQIDNNAMGRWSTEHRQLIEQEGAAKTAAERIRQAQPIAPPTSGPNMNLRRDTPQAFQNDPGQEGPIVGSGPPTPMGQPNDVMGEFAAPHGQIDSQMAQFIQFYNSLPPGSPYTAPDGSHRVKR